MNIFHTHLRSGASSPLFWLLTLGILVSSCTPKSQQADGGWVITPPAGDKYCEVNPAGETVIPNGRLIKPYGNTFRIAPHPFGLCLSPDGRTAVTANSGTRPFSISVLRDVLSGKPEIQQVPEGAENNESLLEAVFMGLVITPDNQGLYVAGGKANKVFRLDLSGGTRQDSIDCRVGTRHKEGYLGDMVLTRDGKKLYVVDQIGFRLLEIDTEKGEIAHSIPTGRYPFGLALSPDESEVYVANVGMFAYSLIEPKGGKSVLEAAVNYPTSKFGSKEMVEGYENDSMKVAGLGDPNAPETFSVWVVDAKSREVTQKIKTGFLVGEEIEGIPAVGGSSPNSIVANDSYIFVSNGNNDCVSVIDPKADSVIKNISLQPDTRLKNWRGIIPFGLAISPDGKRLYVAESGLNAVGVIDAQELEVLGHIPVGWFPSKLEVSPDGKQLIVANAKGYGSGPNGGPTFTKGPEGTYIGNLMKGSVSVFDIPADAELEGLSRQVMDNNFRFRERSKVARQDNPIPLFPGEKESPIKYIVFIAKENRTYDEVFGQLENGKGEASLARYGRNQTFSNKKGTASVTECDVMVNHLALAERFAISDNFYVDSDVSADGHRWLVSTYPNEWVETHVAASYGGKRRAVFGSEAPGNYAQVGASGAVYPEDYNEAGSMWDHFERHNINFFNFGFGMETDGVIEDSTVKYTGVKYYVNFPMPGPLYDRSSRAFPTYNMTIPDQFRVTQFQKEFREKWLGEGKEMPQVITLYLPNDHGAGDRPHAGYPFRESYMMDNDLALGRIVEFLSLTPYWKNMAIVVTEDDAQNGVDHVDAHRSLLMIISPYAKKNYISHVHTSFGSIFKTFWNVLNMRYLNQYDAAAADLADLFTSEPDFSPYVALPVDSRAFEPQKALDPFDENFDWKAVMESPQLDDPVEMVKDQER